jgi:DNA-binding MarR family transcriptional regulator
MDDTDVKLIMDLFDIIGDKLLKTSQFAQDTYEKLTLTEANTVYVIGNETPKTMKQIAETLGVAVSTPTRTVDHLIEKGLVTRSVGKKDRRQLLIELTSKGKKLVEDMDKEGLIMTRKMLENLEDEEVESLKNILLKISENI